MRTEAAGRRTRAPAPQSPRWLFPPGYRGFAGRRWVAITLRSFHLLGVAGLGGLFLYAAPREAWLPYLWLTVGSGGALALLEVWSHGVWLIQLRGVAVLVKLGLLALAPWLAPTAAPWLLAAVIGISGVFSHAPAAVRYYSPFHGRRVEVPE